MRELPSRDLVRRLACPACGGGPLAGDAERLACAGCGAEYPVERGIPAMTPGLARPAPDGPELTVLIMAYNEGENLTRTLAALAPVLEELGVPAEVLVVDGNSADDTAERARRGGARVHLQERPGYGNAFREGLERCRGRYVLTLDADLSHDPGFLPILWEHREEADLVVGSRYMSRSGADLTPFRRYLSLFTNTVFRLVLSIPVQDLTSGYRLYRRAALRPEALEGSHFEILLELLAQMYQRGCRILEIPVYYKPRGVAESKLRVVSFGRAYHRLLRRMAPRRHSPEAADYDERRDRLPEPGRGAALQSLRRRLGARMADLLVVECGSGRLVQAHPGGVGVDARMEPLRYLRLTNPRLVCAPPHRLPFAEGSFGAVVLHRPLGACVRPGEVLAECARVTRPGGDLLVHGRSPEALRLLHAALPSGTGEPEVDHLTGGRWTARMGR